MEIIKPGRINKHTKLFTCDNCGCVFKADEGEYTLSNYFAAVHDNKEVRSGAKRNIKRFRYTGMRRM